MLEFLCLGIVLPVLGAFVLLVLWMHSSRMEGTEDERKAFRKSILAIGCLLLGFTVWMISGLGWTLFLDDHMKTVEERAAPLVNAIERYVAEHGEGPERLSDLVPGYIAEIPEDGMPKGAFLLRPGFQYERWSGEPNGWALRVDWEEIGAPSGSGFHYSSKTKQWQQL